MSIRKNAIALSKLLAYILGRRPDEFGLVPDEAGYVRIKDLLKAVCEEPGWRHVRKGAIDEVLLTVDRPGVEVVDNHIRAVDRAHLQPQPASSDPPRLLYVCVGRRAYPHVLEKGVLPTAHPSVILASTREMAERMGRRTDPEPVVLTVSVRKVLERGIPLHRAGELLYLVEALPPDCFSGPPLPREKPETKKPAPKPAEPETFMPGSFLYNPSQVGPSPGGGGKGKKDRAWKKERRQSQREKNRKKWPI